jgi:hypothetical protein
MWYFESLARDEPRRKRARGRAAHRESCRTTGGNQRKKRLGGCTRHRPDYGRPQVQQLENEDFHEAEYAPGDSSPQDPVRDCVDCMSGH